jgi:4-hydroxy-tetrahydrodipicolinate reductase
MIFKVGILGASGRVGSEIAALLAAGYQAGGDWLELADAVTGSGKLTSIEGVDCRRLEDPPREPVHVWIDFSRPEATLKLLETVDVPVVVGTTGFTESQLSGLRRYAEKAPLLLAPNTSPSLAVVSRLLSEVPRAESFPCDVVVSEEHHKHKKDAPSGTAKRLMAVLAEKGYTNPQVQVTRAGEIIGVHTVKLLSPNEEITITHRVNSRRVFAEGALCAARFLARGVSPRLYSMEEVYFPKEGN